MVETAGEPLTDVENAAPEDGTEPVFEIARARTTTVVARGKSSLLRAPQQTPLFVFEGDLKERLSFFIVPRSSHRLEITVLTRVYLTASRSLFGSQCSCGANAVAIPQLDWVAVATQE